MYNKKAPRNSHTKSDINTTSLLTGSKLSAIYSSHDQHHVLAAYDVLRQCSAYCLNLQYPFENLMSLSRFEDDGLGTCITL